MKRELNRPDLDPEDLPTTKMKGPHLHYSTSTTLLSKKDARSQEETNDKKQGDSVCFIQGEEGRFSHLSLLKKEQEKSSTINIDRKDKYKQSQGIQLNKNIQLQQLSKKDSFARKPDPNPENGGKQDTVMLISLSEVNYSEKEPFAQTVPSLVPDQFIDSIKLRQVFQNFEGENSEIMNFNRNLMIKKHLGEIQVSVIYYQDQQQYQPSLSILYQDSKNKIKADVQITQPILSSSNSPVKDTRTFYSLLVDALEEEGENINNVIRIEGSHLVFDLKQGNKSIESSVKAHCSIVRESEKSKEEAERRFKINILGFVLQNVLFLQKNIKRYLAEETVNLKKEIKQLHTSISNLQTHIKTRLEQQLDLSMIEFKDLLAARIQSFQSRIDHLQSDLRQPFTTFTNVLQDHANQLSFLEHQLEKTSHKMNVYNDELHAKLSELVLNAKSDDENNQAEFRYMDDILKHHSGHIAYLQRKILNQKSDQSVVERLKEENIDSDEDGEFFIQKKQWHNPVQERDTEITRYQEHLHAHLQYQHEKKIKKKQK